MKSSMVEIVARWFASEHPPSIFARGAHASRTCSERSSHVISECGLFNNDNQRMMDTTRLLTCCLPLVCSHLAGQVRWTQFTALA